MYEVNSRRVQDRSSAIRIPVTRRSSCKSFSKVGHRGHSELSSVISHSVSLRHVHLPRSNRCSCPNELLSGEGLPRSEQLVPFHTSIMWFAGCREFAQTGLGSELVNLGSC